MNKEKIKLVYSEKNNQYYRPIEFDDDSKVCKVVVTSNKKDKSIHKDSIARMEQDSGWTFLIMSNPYVTAVDDFIRGTEKGVTQKRMLAVLRKFRVHKLDESEAAMDRLKQLYHEGKFKSYKIKNKVNKLYQELCIGKTSHRNRNTYNQHIPADIKELAKSKDLYIIRNDDYKKDSHGRLVKTTKKQRASIRLKYKCGYLIRNGSGKIVAGWGGYSLSDEDVCKFVKNYEPDYAGKLGEYKVALNNEEWKKFDYCIRTLNKYGLKIKNHNNLRFWVLNDGRVIYGGKDGCKLTGLYKFCTGRSGGIKKYA